MTTKLYVILAILCFCDANFSIKSKGNSSLFYRDRQTMKQINEIHKNSVDTNIYINIQVKNEQDGFFFVIFDKRGLRKENIKDTIYEFDDNKAFHLYPNLNNKHLILKIYDIDFKDITHKISIDNVCLEKEGKIYNYIALYYPQNKEKEPRKKFKEKRTKLIQLFNSGYFSEYEPVITDTNNTKYNNGILNVKLQKKQEENEFFFIIFNKKNKEIKESVYKFDANQVLELPHRMRDSLSKLIFYDYDMKDITHRVNIMNVQFTTDNKIYDYICLYYSDYEAYNSASFDLLFKRQNKINELLKLGYFDY